MAIQAGAKIAPAPLTALLAPEIGPAAPFVAEAIVWIAEHTAEGLRGWVCDAPDVDPEILRRALEYARKQMGIFQNTVEGIGREIALAAAAMAAKRRAFFEAGEDAALIGMNQPNNRPLASQHFAQLADIATRGGPTVMADLAAETMGRAIPVGGTAPIFPIVSGPHATGFTPQPIPRTVVGIATWPRMDEASARRFERWDRYQGTWNGQPNATFPKVGF